MPFTSAATALIDAFLKTRPGKKPPLVVILGPTASGKTALSVELAEHFKGEVISADSRQVYRHMDIGTDKIPLDKRRGIAHHLIDVVNPDERFTVADFKAASEKLIPEITARGNLPFVVGGTGLYIRALTENFAIPTFDPVLRERLTRELAENGPEKLHERLKKVDPESAAKIHFNNHPYVVRALEIFELTGTPKSELKGDSNFEVLKIGLRWPREIMFERINSRAQEQIYVTGLLDETKMLLEKGYSPALSSMSSLGYREMILHLQENMPLAAATELLKQNTRNYGKRQLTWFKKEPKVHWLEGAL